MIHVITSVSLFWCKVDSLIFVAKFDDIFSEMAKVWVSKCSDKVGKHWATALSFIFVQQETDSCDRTTTISHVVACLTF